MFEEGELINLFFGAVSVFVLSALLKDVKNKEFKSFKNGCLIIICAYFFTVVEGFFMEPFFNFLEHLCYALSGICFFYACINLPRSQNLAKDEKK